MRDESFLRAVFELEALEPRTLLTIVPIDATAGVLFEGLVATNLRLPSYATSLELVNVMINGQWDYAPTAVVKPDGSFDLYTSMTPQVAGTGETTIWFRNDLTGGWDILEAGEQTVKFNHFSAVTADTYHRDLVPGTQFRDELARFNTSSLTQSLENYVVEVTWFGDTRAGRLVQNADGTVSAYVDNTYLEIGGGGEVTVTIRLANAPPDSQPVGLARTDVTSYPDIGIGMFYGSMTSDTSFSIDLPNEPYVVEGDRYHYFVPATELEGWPSTLTVELLWQYQDNDVTTSTGTVVRNSDGSYAIIGEVPAGIVFDNGMIRIKELVQRPALDDMPATTYEVEYVGSFNILSQPVEPDPTEEIPPTNEVPQVVDPIDEPVEEPGPPVILVPANLTGAMSDINEQADADSIAVNVFGTRDDVLFESGEEADDPVLVIE